MLIPSNNNNNNNNFAVRTKLIEQLTVSDVAVIDANLWTMSPPCQPFSNTHGAKQMDAKDNRSAGFLSILSLLRSLTNSSYRNRKPKWILMENVAGFHGSEAWKLWIKCLEDCDYGYREYLLSPTGMGIPNHRTRYYTIAELGTDRLGSRKHHVQINSHLNKAPFHPPCQTFPISQRQIQQTCAPLHHYLQNDITTEELETLLVPSSTLSKPWAKNLPVVTPFDCHSHCFTAAYARRLHRATGSLLLMPPPILSNNHNDPNTNNTNTNNHESSWGIPLTKCPLDRSDMTKYANRLRRFSTLELLNLFGFPSTFDFPPDISLEHKYKLIGNSINVSVVTQLMTELLLPIL
mmetsp:Transcript_4502/g.6372  ORF Transcript_4502/g.6372 Transcript_4502/m.6372 type:complete len:349 (+) Transcript_4502:374-1420(+)